MEVDDELYDLLSGLEGEEVEISSNSENSDSFQDKFITLQLLPVVSTREDQLPRQSQTQSLKQKNKKNRRCTRKPCYQPKYMPQLRILRRDIRRKYPEMIQNVINSSDIELLSSFYEHFFIPTVEVINLDCGESVYDSYQWPKHTKGYPRYLQAMNMVYQLFPDAVYYLDDVQISVVLHERGSRIVGRMRSKRTQVVGAKFLSKKSIGDVDHVADDEHPPFELVPLDSPIINEMDGKFVLYLDEGHRVEKVEMFFDTFTLTPSPNL